MTKTETAIEELKQALPQIYPAEVEIKEFAKSHDLIEPLEKSFLESLSLKDLETLKTILIERAAAVIGELNSLRATDEFSANQYARLMFTSEHRDETGKLLFFYSPEPRFFSENCFVPGKWFAGYLSELEKYREAKQKNAESFPENQKNRLIDSMVLTETNQTTRTKIAA